MANRMHTPRKWLFKSILILNQLHWRKGKQQATIFETEDGERALWTHPREGVILMKIRFWLVLCKTLANMKIWWTL